MDGNTSLDLRSADQINHQKYVVIVTLPDDGELGAALMRSQRHLQAEERREARIANRETRTITIQDVILQHCCEMEGVASADSPN